MVVAGFPGRRREGGDMTRGRPSYRGHGPPGGERADVEDLATDDRKAPTDGEAEQSVGSGRKGDE